MLHGFLEFFRSPSALSYLIKICLLQIWDYTRIMCGCTCLHEMPSTLREQRVQRDGNNVITWMKKSKCVLTGMVWLPCSALIADWASTCVENLTKAQPANRERERERRSDFIKHCEQKRVRTLDGGAGAGGAQQAGPLQAVCAPGSRLQTALIKQQMLVGGTCTSTHTKRKHTTTGIISSHINSMFLFLRQVGKRNCIVLKRFGDWFWWFIWLSFKTPASFIFETSLEKSELFWQSSFSSHP